MSLAEGTYVCPKCKGKVHWTVEQTAPGANLQSEIAAFRREAKLEHLRTNSKCREGK